MPPAPPEGPPSIEAPSAGVARGPALQPPPAGEPTPAAVLSPSRRPSRLLLVDEAPSLLKPPSGCAFHPRCARYAGAGSPAVCRTEVPVLRPNADGEPAAGPPRLVACHLA